MNTNIANPEIESTVVKFRIASHHFNKVSSTVLALKIAQVFGKLVEKIFFLEEND